MAKQYYLYILSNKSHTVLYTGITNHLLRRIQQHQTGKGSQFVARYHVTKLVYYEHCHDIGVIIKREKQIKRWRRQWKERLIGSMNPEWKDLSIHLR